MGGVETGDGGGGVEEIGKQVYGDVNTGLIEGLVMDTASSVVRQFGPAVRHYRLVSGRADVGSIPCFDSPQFPVS